MAPDMPLALLVAPTKHHYLSLEDADCKPVGDTARLHGVDRWRLSGRERRDSAGGCETPSSQTVPLPHNRLLNADRGVTACLSVAASERVHDVS